MNKISTEQIIAAHITLEFKGLVRLKHEFKNMVKSIRTKDSFALAPTVKVPVSDLKPGDVVRLSRGERFTLGLPNETLTVALAPRNDGWDTYLVFWAKDSEGNAVTSGATFRETVGRGISNRKIFSVLA